MFKQQTRLRLSCMTWLPDGSVHLSVRVHLDYLEFSYSNKDIWYHECESSFKRHFYFHFFYSFFFFLFFFSE